ncbi:hypothetical protein [Streptomyces sp. CS131]|uniref:hypothetical protein n=1 Tax=Streptomyces sp. CS131 TaxID=2162711 RepID=UPI001EF72BD5|nr:hypothetical protein [Streptomyces sp. CS131]
MRTRSRAGRGARPCSVPRLFPARGPGGLLEESRLELLGTKIPWYAHPNEKGRDIQAKQVATKIEEVLNR